MRSSDWSSDVCSSDLEPRVPGDAQASLGSCLRRSTSQGLPMTASTPTIDAAEAAHFGALAADWWNPSGASARSEEHTSELQSLMRISYAVFCLKKKKRSKTSNQKRPSTQTYRHHHHTPTSKLIHISHKRNST